MPLPVGAWMSVSRPAAMATHPRAWASVAAAKVSANHSRVGAEKGASGGGVADRDTVAAQSIGAGMVAPNHANLCQESARPRAVMTRLRARRATDSSAAPASRTAPSQRGRRPGDRTPSQSAPTPAFHATSRRRPPAARTRRWAACRAASPASPTARGGSTSRRAPGASSRLTIGTASVPSYHPASAPPVPSATSTATSASQNHAAPRPRCHTATRRQSCSLVYGPRRSPGVGQVGKLPRGSRRVTTAPTTAAALGVDSESGAVTSGPARARRWPRPSPACPNPGAKHRGAR